MTEEGAQGAALRAASAHTAPRPASRKVQRGQGFGLVLVLAEWRLSWRVPYGRKPPQSWPGTPEIPGSQGFLISPDLFPAGIRCTPWPAYHAGHAGWETTPSGRARFSAYPGKWPADAAVPGLAGAGFHRGGELLPGGGADGEYRAAAILGVADGDQVAGVTDLNAVAAVRAGVG